MDNTNKTGGLWNVIISLGAFGLVAALASSEPSVTAFAAVFFLGLSLAVSLISLLHMHLATRESMEALEVDAIQSGRSGEALFAEGEVLPAKRSREQFEKWGVPTFSILALLAQGYAVFLLGFKKIPPMLAELAKDTEFKLVEQPYLLLAAAALLAVILFMRGQFASNLARLKRDRLLQPSSDFVLFNAYILILLAIVAAASFSKQHVDVWVGVGLTVLMAAMAVENLLSMIFEIYRPRVSGRKGRLLYQSRLVGLIAKPENLFTTAGKVLDYQFGFKVSETWGYRFLRERMGLLIGVQVILFWLSTSVVIINASERGYKLDLLAGGAASAQALEPGIHFKMPWPFSEVKRFNPDQVHSFYVGLKPLSAEEKRKISRVPGDEKLRLWLKRTGKDYESLQKTGELYFPTGSGSDEADENLVVPSIPVHYRIYGEDKDGRKSLESGWLKFSHPEEVLENLAYREISRYFLGDTMDNLLRAGREQAKNAIKTNLQQAVDDRGLGVEILYVGLAELRPPAESPSRVHQTLMGSAAKDEMDETAKQYSPIPVASVFESYLTADISRWQMKFLSLSWKENQKTAETFQTSTILDRARSRAEVKVSSAESALKSNIQQNKPFRTAPVVYPLWLQMQMFERSLDQARKFVVIVKDAEVSSDFDLKETIRRGLLDVDLPPKN